MFCPLITIEGACDCECVWVSVCVHTSRCNMELLFWQWRSISFAIFFGTEKKKKKIVLFYFGSSAPPPYFLFSLNEFVLLWKTHTIVYIQLLLRVVVIRGGLSRRAEMEQGLDPSGSDTEPQYRRHWLAGKVRMLEQIQRLQKQEACLFSLLAADCLMSSTAENFLIQLIVPLSDRLGHDTKLLLDTNTVTF